MISFSNSFKNKLILLIAVFQFILISSLGWYFSSSIIHREVERLKETNNYKIKETLTDISTRIDMFSKDIELLASIPSIETYDKAETDKLLKSTTVSSMFLSNEVLSAYNNTYVKFADNTLFGDTDDTLLIDSLLITKTTPLRPYISTIYNYDGNSFIDISVYIQNRTVGYGYLVGKFSTHRFDDLVTDSDKTIVAIFDRKNNLITKSDLIDSIQNDIVFQELLNDKSLSGQITISDKTFYYSTQFNKTSGLGVISLTPDNDIQTTIFRFIIMSIVGLIGLFLITLLISLILSNKLIKPLKDLTYKILLVKEGNLDISTKIDKTDEIGDLANSFDSMRINLRDSFQKLKLFISDLKLINKSINNILLARNLDDLTQNNLTQIASVFNADCVIITLLSPVKEYKWEIKGYHCSSLPVLRDETLLESHNNTTYISTPIIMNNDVIGHIFVEKSKRDYYTHDRLETIEILATQYSVGIEALRLYEEEQQKILIQHDLRNAQIIQNALFPATNSSTENYSIHYYYESAEELSGDWLHYYNMSQQSMLFVIGDVTGHGIAASLLTGEVHSFFSVLSRGLTPSIDKNISKSLFELNSIISSRNDHLNMTLLAANFDFTTMEVEICNAGHNHAILFHIETDGTISTTTLLNLNSRIGELDKKFSSDKYPFEKGDKILFYTDGIIEWTNERGKEWGKVRLIKTIMSHFELSDNDILDNIISEVNNKMAHRNAMDDDLTIALVTIK